MLETMKRTYHEIVNHLSFLVIPVLMEYYLTPRALHHHHQNHPTVRMKTPQMKINIQTCDSFCCVLTRQGSLLCIWTSCQKIYSPLWFYKIFNGCNRTDEIILDFAVQAKKHGCKCSPPFTYLHGHSHC